MSEGALLGHETGTRSAIADIDSYTATAQNNLALLRTLHTMKVHFYA
jgi:hypothetical protein